MPELSALGGCKWGGGYVLMDDQTAAALWCSIEHDAQQTQDGLCLACAWRSLACTHPKSDSIVLHTVHCPLG